jgi:hypothetical protein
MLDDQLVTSGGVSAKEISKALQGLDDNAADKLIRSLDRSDATPWHQKIFKSPHKTGLVNTLESIFKAKPPATP